MLRKRTEVYLGQPGEDGVERVRPRTNFTSSHVVEQLKGSLLQTLCHVGRNAYVKSDHIWHHPRKTLLRKRNKFSAVFDHFTPAAIFARRHEGGVGGEGKG